MTDVRDLLGDLPDVDSNSVAKLHAKGIKSVEDLWRAVGADFDAGLTHVSQDADVDRHELLAILAEGAKPREGNISTLEMLAAFVLLLLFIAAVRRFILVWLPAW